MEFINKYLHPEETFLQRRERAHEMAQPFLRYVQEHYEEVKHAIFQIAEDENGEEYALDCDGNRLPLPCYARKDYCGQPFDWDHPYDVPWLKTDN